MGYSHPSRLLAELSLSEWLDWIAKFELDPFDEGRQDQRQEVLLSAILAPVLGAGFQFPSTRFPYWDQDRLDSGVDTEASLAWYREYRARIGRG